MKRFLIRYSPVFLCFTSLFGFTPAVVSAQQPTSTPPPIVYKLRGQSCIGAFSGVPGGTDCTPIQSVTNDSISLSLSDPKKSASINATVTPTTTSNSLQAQLTSLIEYEHASGPSFITSAASYLDIEVYVKDTPSDIYTIAITKSHAIAASTVPPRSGGFGCPCNTQNATACATNFDPINLTGTASQLGDQVVTLPEYPGVNYRLAYIRNSNGWDYNTSANAGINDWDFDADLFASSTLSLNINASLVLGGHLTVSPTSLNFGEIIATYKPYDPNNSNPNIPTQTVTITNDGLVPEDITVNEPLVAETDAVNVPVLKSGEPNGLLTVVDPICITRPTPGAISSKSTRKKQPGRITQRKPFKTLSINNDPNLRSFRLLPGESATVVILDNLTPAELLPTQDETALDRRGFTGFFRITSTNSGNFDVDLTTTVVAPRPVSFTKTAVNGEPSIICRASPTIDYFSLVTYIEWESSTGYLEDLRDGKIAEKLYAQGLVSQPPCDTSNGETDGRLPLPFSEPRCVNATPKLGPGRWNGNVRPSIPPLTCAGSTRSPESAKGVDAHGANPNGFSSAPYRKASYSIMQDYYWYFAGVRTGSNSYDPIKVSPQTYEIKRSIIANRRSERAADQFEPKHWKYTVSCLGGSNTQSPPPPQ